jgi:hypothetical protein
MMIWLTPRRPGNHIDHFAEAMRRKILHGLRPAPSGVRGDAVGDAVGEEPYTEKHVRVSKRIIRRYSLLWMFGRAFR